MTQGQGLESLIPNKKNNQNNHSDSQKNQPNYNTQNQPQQNSNPAFENQAPVKPQQQQAQPNKNQSQNQKPSKPPVIKRGNKQKPPVYYPPGQQNKQSNQQAPNPPQQNNKQQKQSQPNTQQTEPAPFKVDFEEKTSDQSQPSPTPQTQNQEPNRKPQEEISQPQTSPQEDLTEKKDENQAVFQIEVDKIKPNPFQPRKEYDPQGLKELAQSIREVGIIQPLVVSRIEEEVENGTKVHYQLISGERRLRASKMIGLKTVPAVVRREEVKQDKLSMALIENIQRSDLNPIETARAYSRLQDQFSLTQREIATRVGKSRESVSNTLRLLNLPTDIQNALSQGKLN
ncbi:MAG TPA: ParB/RepB/Spo0J family partition protein, partial [Candidatus Paceibacterota bacterium]|nr:ParB/RepB/Spo0J family partition protein [Candidatus Paceibacterota bacterium]